MLCDWFAAVGDWSTALFGSWPNVTQGVIGSALGSAVGVYGAYRVAVHQMRGDRDAQRQVTGATAAAEIHEKLHAVGQQLTYIKNWDERDSYPEEGISSRRRGEWMTAVEAYLVAGILRAHLLPESINASLEKLTQALRDDVLVWNWLDEETLESVTPADQETLEKVEKRLETTRKQLTDYIREAVGDHRKSPSRK